MQYCVVLYYCNKWFGAISCREQLRHFRSQYEKRGEAGKAGCVTASKDPRINAYIRKKDAMNKKYKIFWLIDNTTSGNSRQWGSLVMFAEGGPPPTPSRCSTCTVSHRDPQGPRPFVSDLLDGPPKSSPKAAKFVLYGEFCGTTSPQICPEGLPWAKTPPKLLRRAPNMFSRGTSGCYERIKSQY